jgi:chromate transporter
MLTLFVTFLKLGAFIFGSGHALANAMQHEIVDKRGWLTAEQFQTGWASGNVLPGPIAPKVVAYVGYQQQGALGAVVATVAYLLPSVGAMTLLAAAFTSEIRGLKAAVRGIKPAVLAVLVDACLSFTGVSIPKGAAVAEHWLPVTVVMSGVVLSIGGMWWLGHASGWGNGMHLLTDMRAVAVFAIAITALVFLRVDTIYVMLGAGVVGLSYLAF